MKTLKDTTLKTLFEVFKMQGITPKLYNYNQQSNTITFINGSEIILKDLYTYPSDPNFDELGSLEITGAFIDEANQISSKAREIVRSRIRYKLDEFGLVSKILYTCNPAKGWVYTDFFDADRKGIIEDDRKFVKSLVTDNPFISPEYIRNLQLASEATKQRLFYGNWDFDDDPALLCDYQCLRSMFSNDFVQRGQRYITTDIAFSNKPSGKFVLLVWDGFRLEKIIAKQNADSREVLNTIIGAATKFGVPMHHVCFDADGIGAYLKGMLPNAYPFHNNGKPYNVNTVKRQFSNLKSQCAFGMADLVNQNKIYVSKGNAKETEEALLSELSIWREDSATFNSDKPHALQGKNEQIEQLKRSPDFADAFLMRYIFELRKPVKIT